MMLISVSALLPLFSMAAPLPKQVGSCAKTFINEIQYRLKSPDANGVYMGIPSSGSAITFTNGGYQVSYDKVPAIHRSQPEDKVRGLSYLYTKLLPCSSWRHKRAYL